MYTVIQSGGALVCLAPGALAQDLVQVHRHLVLLDEALHLALEVLGQHPHQGLGGEPVLGPLLVVALRLLTSQMRTQIPAIIPVGGHGTDRELSDKYHG